MGKGSVRRPKNISDEELEKAWNSIFAGHPNDGQFEEEDDYGNELPSNVSSKAPPPKTHKPKDPDKFIDDLGDA